MVSQHKGICYWLTLLRHSVLVEKHQGTLRIYCQLILKQIHIKESLSAVCSKIFNQLIIYTTHVRSINVPKCRFPEKKLRTVKKTQKSLSLYFLSCYRYLKIFNKFKFHVLRTEITKISPHCPKMGKIKFFYIIEKMSCKNLFFNTRNHCC